MVAELLCNTSMSDLLKEVSLHDEHHRVNMLRKIVFSFISMKGKHMCRSVNMEQTTLIRHKNTKQILFKHEWLSTFSFWTILQILYSIVFTCILYIEQIWFEINNINWTLLLFCCSFETFILFSYHKCVAFMQFCIPCIRTNFLKNWEW